MTDGYTYAMTIDLPSLNDTLGAVFLGGIASFRYALAFLAVPSPILSFIQFVWNYDYANACILRVLDEGSIGFEGSSQYAYFVSFSRSDYVVIDRLSLVSARSPYVYSFQSNLSTSGSSACHMLPSLRMDYTSTWCRTMQIRSLFLDLHG